MAAKDPVSFFGREMAENYDSKSDMMQAIEQSLHALIKSVLRGLPQDAKVLCVGAGTGAEIISLAQKFLNWRFVAVEPSPEMCAKCREKIDAHGLNARCEVLEGYLSDVAPEESFDAILCLLVTHFLLEERDRQAMYDGMATRLRKGGILVNAELCNDPDAESFDTMLAHWITTQNSEAISDERLHKSREMMKQHVAFTAPSGIEAMLMSAGFAQPTEFFQALLIHAWYAQK